MPSALTQTELFALLPAGQTVVLPRPHAAKVLRARFHHHPRPALAYGEPGPALAWQQWTASLWSILVLEGLEQRVLLNRAQEDDLWTEIIAAHPAAHPAAAPNGHSTTSASQHTQLARSGLRLAAAYNAVGRLGSAADTSDARTFAVWADAFRDHCTRHRLLAPALLEAALARHLRAGALPAPPALHLAGFEHHTPAQRDLLSALEAAGTAVYAHPLVYGSASPAPGLALALPDSHEQVAFAARWIAHHATTTPQSFAIITPRAEEHRPHLERLLRQHLAPELEPVTADLSSTPWEFADAPPLRSAALVTDALRLLRWTLAPLPLASIGQLLLSPYVAFADSAEARARFETDSLRSDRLLRPELDLAQLLRLVQDAARRPHSPRFPEFRALAQMALTAESRPATRPHAAWADHARALLSAVGWPGPRPLTPAEFATVEAWEGVLDLLSTLDLHDRRLTWPAFVQRLEAEATELSLGSSSGGAPVQILTLPEAEGLCFDHVLVLDATDLHLPSPEAPHPLLGRHLQAALDMPGLNPAATYTRTRDRLQALAARSGRLHLLAPRADATGPLRLTRLAHDLAFAAADPAQILPPPPPPGTQPVLVDIEDTVSLPPLPSPSIHGGARVLELQAQCGFRAFADLRLAAQEPPTPTFGLNFREAGSRLHGALRAVWQTLPSQADLRSLSTLQRRSLLETAVHAALQPLSASPGADRPWTRAFLPILEERFVTLLSFWLHRELERGPFTPIAQEQQHEITVGPLRLTVRPDRVDQVDNGLVYIDYKTSFGLSTDDWLGSRPDAPQLPLYTLLAEPGEVRGLAFAQLRPGKNMGWLSLADTAGLFPDKKKSNHDLDAEINAWRLELTRLAEAFAAGDASVAPKTFPKTCQYCAFRLLCRLDPTDLLDQADDIDEEDDLEDELHV